MKVRLHFDLSSEDDVYAWHQARQATKMYSVLENFSEWMRSQVKYNDDLSEVQSEFLETIRDKFYGYINDEGVELEY